MTALDSAMLAIRRADNYTLRRMLAMAKRANDSHAAGILSRELAARGVA